MNVKQQELVKTTEVRLEKMRETVDEKLQTTLEKRLGESFKLVSERLEAVHEVLLLHAVLEPRALEGVQEVPALQLRLHRRERADLARPRIELHLQQDGTERKK